jgi:hypothetical protein
VGANKLSVDGFSDRPARREGAGVANRTKSIVGASDVSGSREGVSVGATEPLAGTSERLRIREGAGVGAKQPFVGTPDGSPRIREGAGVGSTNPALLLLLLLSCDDVCVAQAPDAQKPPTNTPVTRSVLRQIAAKTIEIQNRFSSIDMDPRWR